MNSPIQSSCCRSVHFIAKMFVVCTPLSLDCMLPSPCVPLTCGYFLIVAVRPLVCRPEDYWEGYKMFCYAYYSHSSVHESEFRNSKLGSLSSLSLLIQCKYWWVFLVVPRLHRRCVRQLTASTNACVHTGELVWRRHSRELPPSHHVLRNTCMQLLPLVEMYCRWELQEDCSNLRDLMGRYDSEAELQTHELGRSLLFMIRDDDMQFEGLPRAEPPHAPSNPFADVRERLVAMDSAIRDLRPQVHIRTHFLLHSKPTRVGMDLHNADCKIALSLCAHQFASNVLVQDSVQNCACPCTMYFTNYFTHLSACFCTSHLWQTVQVALSFTCHAGPILMPNAASIQN